MSDATTTDQRLLEGARARHAIARHAADVASVEGLTGSSIGRLATDLGVSKSGVATLFGSKERLQLAAVEAAREVFVGRVVTPSRSAAHGVPRLRALLSNWMVYASAPVFPGGCFRVATIALFDDRPRPVRDAIVADHADWLGLLAHEVRRAQEAGDLADTEPDVVAFHIDAILAAANTALRTGDERATTMAQAILDGILAGG